MNQRPPTVVCVLRASGDYSQEQVRALHFAVKRWWPKHLDLRFVALTNYPIGANGIEERPLRHLWQGWWSKMELFDAAQDDLGDILYFDLDTMIIGPLDDIAGTRRPSTGRPLTLLRDFYHEERTNSGLMFLPSKDRPEVCAAWMEDPRAVMSRFRGDGDFLDTLWRKKAACWQDALEGQVVSYKVHVRQRKGQTPPEGARVICFHGRPRPWNTLLWSRDDYRAP